MRRLSWGERAIKERESERQNIATELAFTFLKIVGGREQEIETDIHCRKAKEVLP